MNAWEKISITMKVCYSFNNVMNIAVDKTHMFTHILIDVNLSTYCELTFDNGSKMFIEKRGEKGRWLI